MSTSEPKPRWVKMTVFAIGVSIGVPELLSFIFLRHYAFWQLLALLAGGAWLFVCGFFTAFKPLPIARYFARPGTYELMLRDRHPAITRWYFRISGTVMMAIALFLGSMFFVMRDAPTPSQTRGAGRP